MRNSLLITGTGGLVMFVLGVALGWNIGLVESRTWTAKLGVIVTVEEIQWLEQKEYDKLGYDIRTDMFASVAGVRRLPHNPFWKMRYLFSDPFNDRFVKYALPIAEKESYSIGEMFYPQHYPPLNSGTMSTPHP